MRRNYMVIGKVALLLLLPFLFLGVQMVSAQGNHEPITLRWEDAWVGKQIPLPTSQDGSCLAKNLHIQMPATGAWRWIGIKVEPQTCKAIVMAKWKGELSQGPVSIKRVIQDAKERSGIKLEAERPQSEPERTPDNLGWTYKTSEQRVFTYGYGGTWDKLTQLQHRLRFRYDGTRVMAVSRWGQCLASTWPPTWDWVIDACQWAGWNGGPYTVFSKLEGRFHCDPPHQWPCSGGNGYYHTLYGYIDGHINGVSHCSGWYTGKVVRFTWWIVQGCR